MAAGTHMKRKKVIFHAPDFRLSGSHIDDIDGSLCKPFYANGQLTPPNTTVPHLCAVSLNLQSFMYLSRNPLGKIG